MVAGDRGRPTAECSLCSYPVLPNPNKISPTSQIPARSAEYLRMQSLCPEPQGQADGQLPLSGMQAPWQFSSGTVLLVCTPECWILKPGPLGCREYL